MANAATPPALLSFIYALCPATLMLPEKAKAVISNRQQRILHARILFLMIDFPFLCRAEAKGRNADALAPILDCKNGAPLSIVTRVSTWVGKKLLPVLFAETNLLPKTGFHK